MRKFWLLSALLIAVVFQAGSLVAQSTDSAIKWTSMDEVIKQSKKQKKKIVLELYTDWCGWCKQMNSETFSNDVIVSFVNDNFYALRVNITDRNHADVVSLLTKLKSLAGSNELYEKVKQGDLHVPTLVILDEGFKVIDSITGFKAARQMEALLAFYATNSYMNAPWSSFQRNYQYSVRD